MCQECGRWCMSHVIILIVWGYIVKLKFSKIGFMRNLMKGFVSHSYSHNHLRLVQK